MYLLISYIVLIFSFFLFRKVAGTLSISQPNMISWNYYYQLVLQSFIASILVVYEIDNHYLISKIHNDDVRFQGWLAIQYTMVAMPVGMILTLFLFGKKSNKKNFKNYINSPLVGVITKNDVLIKQMLYLLSLICVLSVGYTYAYLTANPFIAILKMSADQLALLRIINGRNFSGNEYIRNIFAIGLTPILSYIAYGYVKLQNKKVDKYWLIILIIASVLILFYDLQKSPIFFYFFGFIFINVLLGVKINLKKLFKYLAMVLILIISMYSHLSSSDSSLDSLFGNYNQGVTGRLFLTQAAGIYLSFDIFPSSHPFIGFSSLTSLFSYSGNNSERSARIIMETINSKGINEGTAGVINSLFISEAWANFGLVGVLIAPLIVGIELQFIYQYILKSRKTPLMLGLYAYFSLHIPITGGFNDFLYNVQYLVIIITFGGMYILAKAYHRNY